MEPFGISQQSSKQISFTKSASITNYAGFTFDLQIDRTVSVVSPSETLKTLGVSSLAGIQYVGYKTTNQLKNVGNQAWTKDKGLLSIWLLGMLKHSETTTVVIPYIQGAEADLGKIINDDYFGKVPADRLVVTNEAIFFKGDGQQRGKIGLSPHRAKDLLGSYDAENKLLTIIKYNKPKGVTDYVNSKWELQKQPYVGDVINAYNDGAPEPGAKPLGPFYELESSSPARALVPDEMITHIQYTFHFEGNKADLDKIARFTLGVGLTTIEAAFSNTSN